MGYIKNLLLLLYKSNKYVLVWNSRYNKKLITVLCHGNPFSGAYKYLKGRLTVPLERTSHNSHGWTQGMDMGIPCYFRNDLTISFSWFDSVLITVSVSSKWMSGSREPPCIQLIINCGSDLLSCICICPSLCDISSLHRFGLTWSLRMDTILLEGFMKLPVNGLNASQTLSSVWWHLQRHI